jgi:hypothetical protein
MGKACRSGPPRCKPPSLILHRVMTDSYKTTLT